MKLISLLKVSHAPFLDDNFSYPKYFIDSYRSRTIEAIKQFWRWSFGIISKFCRSGSSNVSSKRLSSSSISVSSTSFCCSKCSITSRLTKSATTIGCCCRCARTTITSNKVCLSQHFLFLVLNFSVQFVFMSVCLSS